eukprot:TRINITY_DN551_c0_g1_i16.p1 TRINITY_DN551_c0_g1~~TRINITY_DN551_c0_g1_i16.p1  ORF type:complete len:572 (+),score=104.43 TRINITY_DN551_c0_g1_i16:3079-4794(+)
MADIERIRLEEGDDSFLCKTTCDLLSMLSSDNTNGIRQLMRWMSGGGDKKRIKEVSRQMSKGHLITPHVLYKMIEVHLILEAGLPAYVMGEAGVGKTEGMRALALLRGNDLNVVNVHGGMTPEDIKKCIAGDIAAAKKGEKRLLMFDEANSTRHVCWKQLLSDRILCGERLPDNLQLLCMVNPVRYKTRTVHDIDSEGLPASMTSWSPNTSELVYDVHKASDSTLVHMVHWPNPCLCKVAADEAQACIRGRTNLQFVTDAGKVSDEVLMVEHAVYSFVDSQQFALETNNLYNNEWSKVFIRSLLVALICKSQQHFRELYQCSNIVSLRVIERVIQCLWYGMTLAKERADQSFGDLVLECGIYFSLFANYAARLTNERREAYYRSMKIVWCRVVQLSNRVPTGLDEYVPIGDTSLELARWLVDELVKKAGDGIAKTDAFSENVVMMYMAIQMGQVLHVLGMPGTGKSLAMDTLVSGTHDPLFPIIRLPNQIRDTGKIIKSCMQCSRFTTPQSIADLMENSARRQNSLEEEKHRDIATTAGQSGKSLSCVRVLNISFIYSNRDSNDAAFVDFS